MKRNIVLIGMPCSGKTTIGRMLAGHLNRQLLDTDDIIVNRAGMPVAEIFRLRGEPQFRELEAQAVRDAAQVADGRVISTGGGAILRKDNVAALRRTGLLIFLDRPLTDLLPTADRPTANSAGKMKTLYRARYRLYRTAADYRVTVVGTPEEVLSEVLACLDRPFRSVS